MSMRMNKRSYKRDNENEEEDVGHQRRRQEQSNRRADYHRIRQSSQERQRLYSHDDGHSSMKRPLTRHPRDSDYNSSSHHFPSAASSGSSKTSSRHHNQRIHSDSFKVSVMPCHVRSSLILSSIQQNTKETKEYNSNRVYGDDNRRRTTRDTMQDKKRSLHDQTIDSKHSTSSFSHRGHDKRFRDDDDDDVDAYHSKRRRRDYNADDDRTGSSAIVTSAYFDHSHHDDRHQHRNSRKRRRHSSCSSTVSITFQSAFCFTDDVSREASHTSL